MNLQTEDRIPKGVGHASFVRSLNGVPIVAERAVVRHRGSGPPRRVHDARFPDRRARTWYFAGGGPTADRDEFITLVNLSDIRGGPLQHHRAWPAGQDLAIDGLQDLAAGARRARGHPAR